MLLRSTETGHGSFSLSCSNTGFRVQCWVEDDDSEDSCEARLHLVNLKRAKQRAATTSRARGEFAVTFD